MDPSSRAERGYCRGWGMAGKGTGTGRGRKGTGKGGQGTGEGQGKGMKDISNEGDEGRNKTTEDTVYVYL